MLKEVSLLYCLNTYVLLVCMHSLWTYTVVHACRQVCALQCSVSCLNMVNALVMENSSWTLKRFPAFCIFFFFLFMYSFIVDLLVDLLIFVTWTPCIVKLTRVVMIQAYLCIPLGVTRQTKQVVEDWVKDGPRFWRGGGGSLQDGVGGHSIIGVTDVEEWVFLGVFLLLLLLLNIGMYKVNIRCQTVGSITLEGIKNLLICPPSSTLGIAYILYTSSASLTL